MNVNLHLLNASGSLDNFTEKIENSFREALNDISKKIKISDIDVVVYDNPHQTIPEFGMGGYAQSANLIFIPIDPKFSNLSKTIEHELKRTLAHEIHHCLRWRGPGYGKNLLEAIITEGLADHFDLEINGGNPPIWSSALSKRQLEKLLVEAKKEFKSENYDHNEWFFGSKKRNIPRWAGYSLGFKIVGDYLERDKDKKPSELYNTKAENFLN